MTNRQNEGKIKITKEECRILIEGLNVLANSRRVITSFPLSVPTDRYKEDPVKFFVPIMFILLSCDPPVTEQQKKYMRELVEIIDDNFIFVDENGEHPLPGMFRKNPVLI